MSLIESQTLWFKKNEAVDVADSPVYSEWYNAEVLNSGQFFLQYTGTSNVQIDVELSPIEAHGRMVDAAGAQMLPGDAKESITALTSGANNSEGFFHPTAGGPFDRPFKSFRTKMTLSASITACYFGLCHNAAPPG